MKVTQLSMAVAAALFAGQAMAAAVTPADITAARQAGTLQEAWISGASAPTYNVFQGFAAGCEPNTLSFFHDTATAQTKPGSAGDNLGYACVRGGKVSVLYHTIAGGSYNAYAPHLDGVRLTRLKNLNSLSSNGCTLTSATLNVNANQAAAPIYRSCANGVGATLADGAPTLPAGGFSDVEAALFGKSVAGFGTERAANVGQVFGVVVSVPLYRALQRAQGVSEATIAADINFDPVNAPNISSAQYTALITGAYTDWSKLIPSDTTTQVRIARRVDTSGTQASSNAYFLKNPCNGNPAILGALFPQTAASAAGLEVPTYIVTEDSSTSSMKNKFKNTTDETTDDYVIGVMSAENDYLAESAQNASRNGYRFIKLDGVHPEAPDADVNGQTKDPKARNSAVNGNYGFHMEMVGFTANSATGFGANVVGEIIDQFATVACEDVPRGLTLNPLAGSSCVAGKQVAKMSRGGNNCQANQMLF